MVYVIGEVGLMMVLYDVGYVFIDCEFDYVVFGEMCMYLFEVIIWVIWFIEVGVCFIVINFDFIGFLVEGLLLVMGLVVVFILWVIGVELYFVGKFNLFMMCSVLNCIDVYLELMVMVGDCMDIDIVSGFEVGLCIVLVLIGLIWVE